MAETILINVWGKQPIDKSFVTPELKDPNDTEDFGVVTVISAPEKKSEPETLHGLGEANKKTIRKSMANNGGDASSLLAAIPTTPETNSFRENHGTCKKHGTPLTADGKCLQKGH